MAPPGAGRGGARRRGGSGGRGGSKPQAHKGRATRSMYYELLRATGGRNAAGTPNNGEMSAGANWKNRRRNRPRRSNDNMAASSNDNNSNNTNNNRRNPRKKLRRSINGEPNSGGLQPIRVKSSGIMSTWKKPLGGLIRYYVHTRMHDKESPVDQKTAEDEVDRFYYRSNCSMEDTKTMILESLGVTRDIQKGWIDISMAIEKDAGMDNIPISNQGNKEDSMDASNVNGDDVSSGFAESVDGKGLKLKQVLRLGEGPAHSHEQWTTIVVPDWAVGKSYFFQVKNYSPLNLSCELFLDGEKVAFNAPLLSNSTRTIRPDAVRYYQRHQWILRSAVRKRVNFASARNDTFNGSNSRNPPPTPRYNGLRPDYAGQRVSLESYPDPTTFGWNFTGSVQESSVEFFEKRMNIGCVKMDFYYTTGTVKTVLDHPSSGTNQLFRAKLTPEKFVDILKDPRAHTNQGYRRIENRPAGNVGNQEEEEDDEFDRLPTNNNVENQTGNDEEMEDAGVPGTYFAKDDNYDFKRQGHQNRVAQINKLQQSNDYAEWKEANKKEYAVIHAKFYVSIPKRMYGAPPKSAGGGSKQRRGKHMTPLPVPEQATVVDVKAAENATLGTKYESTGPPQNMGRSSVRMERINGLTDDKEWKGEPVFEQKLYYRAENIVSGQGLGDESDEMSEDENEEGVQNPPLNEYKAEKIYQVRQYYSELSMCIVDPEEAEQRLRNVKNKIHLSESVEDVDDVVKLFHSDLVHRQIVGNRA